MSPVTDSTATRERSAVELVKEASAHLRGSIAEELTAPGDAFSADTVHLTKFHGFYQQDDRDVRRARTAAKLPLLSSCMVRAAVPGGVLTARQWLAMDRLAEQVARTAPRGAGAPAPNLRVTTRQGVQFHFVAKAEIRPLIAALNAELVTTLAACGDVARNVMGCPAPLAERNGLDLAALAQPLAAHVRPRTPAYYELWLDGEKAASVHAAEPGPANTSGSDVEPLYGDTYLPRKFKIAIAWPGDNCVDLFSHDLGFVPTFAGPAGPGTLEGFTVFAGGGMGQNHSRPDDTYPRLATALGWVPADAIGLVAEAVIGTFRDHGDRTDRGRARLKYLIDDRGADWFRGDVAERLSARRVSLEDARPLPEWTADDEHLGWHEQHDGRFFRGVHVDAGRVVDATGSDGQQVRTALRTLAASGLVDDVRLTARQDVLLTGIDADRRGEVDEVLAAHGVLDGHALTPVRRLAVACPALPTCGQALAEAERALPDVVAAAEGALSAAGLAAEPVRIHMTGCPNGCARPYTAEIGIVGRTKTTYDVYAGGSSGGDRLARRLATGFAVAQLDELFGALFARFAAERAAGETFGEFVDRVGIGTLADTVPVAAPRRRSQ